MASSRVVADDALARNSAAAVHGRVVALDSTWDPSVGAIYTNVTLDVLRGWGLPGSPARIVVKQLGGVVGETALIIGGQARFEIGEEVFVFLDVRPRDRTLSVASLEHGKWTTTASTDPARAMAREIRGHDPSRVVARDYKSMTELMALAALVGTRASAASADLAAGSGGLRGDQVAPAFTLLSPSTPARWHEADTGTTVWVESQSGGDPYFAGGGRTQIGRAADLWAAAGSLPLRQGGERSARCFNNSEAGDARISVTYGDPCGEIADESWTLAIGGAYYSASDVRTVGGVSYWKITKGMIVTDNAPWKYSGMSTGCYEEMVAHELGHTIGFGHSPDRGALMYPSITSDCGQRSGAPPLGSDDRAAMAALYPREVVADPPPNAPTNLTASVAGGTVTLRWTPPASGSTPQAYRLYAGSAPGFANFGYAVTNATSLVVPNVPNGVYYVRVTALNASGESAPTPDYVVPVQTVPPAPPENAMAIVGAGGVVHITWRPPSTGGTPTGYRVLAGYAPGQTLFTFPVAGTTLSGSGVPPATYYARIVAVNAAGVSAPSVELTITVVP
jgi:hypothetical protein